MRDASIVLRNILVMDDPKDDPLFEGTRVDLGEDLLEGTHSEPIQQEDDDLQRGEILMNERLFDDAKKIFRKILRQDPANVIAKQRLDEILKIEWQDLLGGEAPKKRLGSLGSSDDENPSHVLERLEKELHINLSKTELKPVPDLFPDQMALAKYRDRLMESVVALPPRDRIDIGIAHLEMGLFEVAQTIFETVVRYEEHKLSGMYLLGLALIYGDKAIEASIRLEPLARELTLSEEQKTHFLYLMGLAFERLRDVKKAREFYRRVHLLNSRYRDVVEKLNLR
jgi:tetratricopeptide (TPR) repeat protein